MQKEKPYKEDLFVLRHWQVAEGKRWKISMKNLKTKELRFFSNPELLLNFFEEQEKDET